MNKTQEELKVDIVRFLPEESLYVLVRDLMGQFTKLLESPRNRTCSYPLISSLRSLSSASASSALSAFSLQLCLALALSASNTYASSSIARVSLLSVSTLSSFTSKIPVCSSSSASLCNTSSSASCSFHDFREDRKS